MQNRDIFRGHNENVLHKMESFFCRDWTPQTLRVIYELFDDKIVDMYLDGELEKSEPNLVDFFENLHKQQQ